MAPRKRTYQANELRQEAHLMVEVLEKAMEGQRIKASHPTVHGAPHTLFTSVCA
jgi:hypothetical protein